MAVITSGFLNACVQNYLCFCKTGQLLNVASLDNSSGRVLTGAAVILEQDFIPLVHHYETGLKSHAIVRRTFPMEANTIALVNRSVSIATSPDGYILSPSKSEVLSS